MGLFSRRKSRDFAQEFKESYSKQDVKTCRKIFDEWCEIKPIDSNYYCACVIFLSYFVDVNDQEQLNNFMDLAIKVEETKPLNQDLEDWYKERAAVALNALSSKL